MKWIASLFRGRGLYWALSLCIVIAAACSFFAVKNIVEQNKPQTDQGGEAVWDLPKAPVEQDVEDVPIKATPAPTAMPRPSASARPSPSPASSSGSSEQPAPTAAPEEPAAALAPSFVWPVDGQTGQEYSGDELVYNETLKDWRTHNGLDIFCEAESPVKSAVAGRVTAVYEDGMWGQIVEIDDGAITWRYCGLASGSVLVKAGGEVLAGQAIATLNQAPAESALEPHLHLETLRGGNYEDPRQYLSEG